MTKLEKALALAFTTMTMPVQANNSITSITNQSNENVINVLSQTPSYGQGETIAFENAKNMQEFQGLFEEIMDDENFKVLIDKYGYEDVQKVLKEILLNENTKHNLKTLLEDEEIQQALKEGNEDLVKEKVSNKCKTDVGLIVFFTIVVELVIALLIYGGKKFKECIEHPRIWINDPDDRWKWYF